MRQLLLATRNEGKVRELAPMLADLEVRVLCLRDFPDVAEVVEDGQTFEDNARKKAVEVRQATGIACLADDSGLVVDALAGQPGIYSARYGGPGLSDAERCVYLLGRLAAEGVERSSGRFVCVMALAAVDGTLHLRRAEWDGLVGGPPRGENGFGYDPLFELPGRGITSAMLPSDEKNRLSHRGQAVAQIVALLHQEPALLG